MNVSNDKQIGRCGSAIIGEWFGGICDLNGVLCRNLIHCDAALSTHKMVL